MSEECPHCHLLSPDGTTRCDCGYDFKTGVAPAATPREGAGLGERFFASLIDNVLMLIVSFLVFVALPATDLPDPARRGLGTLVGLAVSFCYLVVAWGIWGSSIGKRTMGLRVVRMLSSEPPGLFLAAVRWVVLVFTQWISGIVVLVRKDRRGLHDLVAGTQVVEAWRARVTERGP